MKDKIFVLTFFGGMTMLFLLAIHFPSCVKTAEASEEVLGVAINNSCLARGANITTLGVRFRGGINLQLYTGVEFFGHMTAPGQGSDPNYMFGPGFGFFVGATLPNTNLLGIEIGRVRYHYLPSKYERPSVADHNPTAWTTEHVFSYDVAVQWYITNDFMLRTGGGFSYGLNDPAMYGPLIVLGGGYMFF